MRELIIALISSSLAVLITSFINYHFLMRKEFRLQANSYKIEILQKVYTPIVKLLYKEVYPGDGYEGISINAFSDIDKIINENYQFISPELDTIIWSLKEESIHYGHSDGNREIDEGRVLLDHVMFNFNYYRKELGLPYDKVQLRVEKKRINKQQKKKEKQREKNLKEIDTLRKTEDQ